MSFRFAVGVPTFRFVFNHKVLTTEGSKFYTEFTKGNSYQQKGTALSTVPFLFYIMRVLLFAFDLLHGISFDNIIHLDIVVSFNGDTALISGFYFRHVIFKPL